ncbi:hypothetical protein Tco_0644113 [Tanacetum coccineum]
MVAMVPWCFGMSFDELIRSGYLIEERMKLITISCVHNPAPPALTFDTKFAPSGGKEYSKKLGVSLEIVPVSILLDVLVTLS